MAATKTETKQEMVSVFIPKISGEDQMFFVGLNGRNWIIPRGKTVEVPKSVANIVNMHNRMVEHKDEYSDEHKKLMHQVQGAPV